MTLLRTAVSALALATVATSAAAFEDGKLVIWLGDNRHPEKLAEAVAAFEDDFGVEVVIEVADPDLPQKFQQAASTGDGPDIFMYAHDRLGEYARGGLIAPVSPSQEFVDGILPVAIDAVSFDNRIWGYPMSVEAVGLVYNKDLVDTPPASFEEVAALELPEGVAPILWDYNNTYFTMPLLMAGGGYAFQKVDGSFDGEATGVNNEGSVAGAALLKSMIDDGVMPAGIDYGVMDAAMAKGEVAMILNGPWSWNAYRDAGINVGVAPLPSVNGEPAKPFIGVQAMAINAASPNADLAAELIENYIGTDEGLATWNADGALGALADTSAAEAQDNELVAAMLEGAANGVPMPVNPEMGAFWGAMGPALTNITSGASDVQAALDDAAARILAE